MYKHPASWGTVGTLSVPKFMQAEGGIARIVWMPKELKDDVGERLNQTAKELYGIDNLQMICDETIATEIVSGKLPDRKSHLH